MKLYTLLEAETSQSAQRIADLLARDCQPFLQEINYKVADLAIFREMEGEVRPFIKKEVRLQDRQPTGSPLHWHNTMNKFFVENFGEPFRNAMFAVGNNYADAASYGMVYAAFPIGNFKYVWSPYVADMFVELDAYLNEYLDYTKNPDETEMIYKFLNQQKYTNQHLDAAIRTGNEIMIRCPHYYGVKARRDPNKVRRNYYKYGIPETTENMLLNIQRAFE